MLLECNDAGILFLRNSSLLPDNCYGCASLSPDVHLRIDDAKFSLVLLQEVKAGHVATWELRKIHSKPDGSRAMVRVARLFQTIS